MPNSNKTDVTFVLDRSGSMSSRVKDVIGGFNRLLDDQVAVPGECLVSVVQFDHEYEALYSGRPVAEAPKLTEATYVPRGQTALLDAVGRAIVATGDRLKTTPEADRPGKIVFVIVTDGEENHSREYSKAKIAEMVLHQSAVYRWQFVYLGANVDAFAEARDIGVPVTTAAAYAATPAGVHCAYQNASANLRAFRTGAVATMDWSPEQREAMGG